MKLTTAISIHAPRAGSDCRAAEADGNAEKISIHAPRAGSDEVGLHIL